jgi:hypothetical protein
MKSKKRTTKTREQMLSVIDDDRFWHYSQELRYRRALLETLLDIRDELTKIRKQKECR